MSTHEGCEGIGIDAFQSSANRESKKSTCAPELDFYLIRCSKTEKYLDNNMRLSELESASRYHSGVDAWAAIREHFGVFSEEYMKPTFIVERVDVEKAKAQYNRSKILLGL